MDTSTSKLGDTLRLALGSCAGGVDGPVFGVKATKVLVAMFAPREQPPAFAVALGLASLALALAL